MYAPQQGMFGTFVRRHAVHDGPVDPDDRGPLQGARLPDRVLRQVAPVLPRRAADQPRGGARHRAGNPLDGYGFDHSAISPPADVGGYNDGYTNDPVWTGQAVDFLKQHARRRQAVAVRAEPAQPARHPVLPARLPRRLQAARLRRRARAVLLRRADARRQADRASSASATSSRSSPGRRTGVQNNPDYWRGQLNTYYDLIVGTDEMLGAAIKDGHRRGRARRHGDRADGRPRRARLGAPHAEQGHDDVRRAEPRPVHRRLPQALPARQALAGARRGRRPGADAAGDRRRSRPRRRAGRGCAA